MTALGKVIEGKSSLKYQLSTSGPPSSWIIRVCQYPRPEKLMARNRTQVSCLHASSTLWAINHASYYEQRFGLCWIISPGIGCMKIMIMSNLYQNWIFSKMNKKLSLWSRIWWLVVKQKSKWYTAKQYIGHAQTPTTFRSWTNPFELWAVQNIFTKMTILFMNITCLCTLSLIYFHLVDHMMKPL